MTTSEVAPSQVLEQEEVAAASSSEVAVEEGLTSSCVEATEQLASSSEGVVQGGVEEAVAVEVGGCSSSDQVVRR